MAKGAQTTNTLQGGDRRRSGSASVLDKGETDRLNELEALSENARVDQAAARHAEHRFVVCGIAKVTLKSKELPVESRRFRKAPGPGKSAEKYFISGQVRSRKSFDEKNFRAENVQLISNFYRIPLI